MFDFEKGKVRFIRGGQRRTIDPLINPVTVGMVSDQFDSHSIYQYN